MSRLFLCRPFVRAGLAAGLVWMLALDLPRARGQEANAAATADQGGDTEAKPEAVTIADEPTTVDPASLMPPALAKPVKVEFTDASLSDVADWLRKEQKLEVLFDMPALADKGILLSDPVTDRSDNAPLYLLLNRLSSLDLAWYVEDNILHITTESAASQLTYTESYAIGDLLDNDYDELGLLETISEIAPDEWSSQGGPGTAQILGDVLFVRHTHAMQRQISGFLAALRKHGRRTFTLDPPQHEALRRKLDQQISVTFREEPISSAIAQLATQAEIDIRLDMRALRQLGLRGREPVTLALSNRKLSTVLQVLLANYRLTPLLRNGVLWITSRDVADNRVKTAIFDVRDLCPPGGDADGLQQAIEEQTAPETWSSQGGPGSIEFPREGTLFIAQTDAVHEEILQLLERYREAMRITKRRVRPEDDPNRVVTRYYRMEGRMAEDLEKWLPKLVAPDSWETDAKKDAVGTIVRLASSSKSDDSSEEATTKPTIEYAVLIVQQSQKNHDEISEVINRVWGGDESAGGGHFGFGGMGGMGGGMPEPAPSAGGGLF